MTRVIVIALVFLLVALFAGCVSPPSVAETAPPVVQPVERTGEKTVKVRGAIQVAFQEAVESIAPPAPLTMATDADPLEVVSLAGLEELALNENPALMKLYREYEAAAVKACYVDKLPDPRIGANVFGNPLQTMSGSQRANLSVMQVIPWLSKLDAEAQRANLQALAMRADYQAAQLTVLAGVRTAWYRLYVLDKQIETAEANQQLLQSLIDIANARIATGTASQGDVLLGTLELSQLEERLLTLHRQRVAVETELNRLTDRPPQTPVISLDELVVERPQWSVEQLQSLLPESQPDVLAAELRTQATRWGVEVARLQRRPELMLSANYMMTDDNRPASTVVDVGEDPWSIGAQVSVPLWRNKYDAMESEATWRHFAAHDAMEDVLLRYEARLVDLLAEARRAAETAELYESTIIPQARQTLSADQESYANGTVEFDRVVGDYRNLLTLELGYHQAVGELAIAIANIRQAVGRDVLLSGDIEPARDAEDVE